MLRRFSTQYVSGISDSPMWNRGKGSRSNSRTLKPCCAMSVDVVAPAGPPPITTTSVSVTGRVSVELIGGLSLEQGGRLPPAAFGCLVRGSGPPQQVDQSLQ